MKTLTDRGVILARLITGSPLTINESPYPNRGAWLNKWQEGEQEIDFGFAQELLNLQLVQLDSGNFDTGEHYYFFRVITRKKNRKWRLDVQKDESECQMIFRERQPTRETPMTKIEKAVFVLNKGNADLRDQAIAEGHKDEECGSCGAVLLAHHHFVSCRKGKDCPMSNGKSLLEMFLDHNSPSNHENTADSTT